MVYTSNWASLGLGKKTVHSRDELEGRHFRRRKKPVLRNGKLGSWIVIPGPA